jgi:hypothetical protein
MARWVSLKLASHSPSPVVLPSSNRSPQIQSFRPAPGGDHESVSPRRRRARPCPCRHTADTGCLRDKTLRPCPRGRRRSRRRRTIRRPGRTRPRAPSDGADSSSCNTSRPDSARRTSRQLHRRRLVELGVDPQQRSQMGRPGLVAEQVDLGDHPDAGPPTRPNQRRHVGPREPRAIGQFRVALVPIVEVDPENERIHRPRRQVAFDEPREPLHLGDGRRPDRETANRKPAVGVLGGRGGRRPKSRPGEHQEKKESIHGEGGLPRFGHGLGPRTAGWWTLTRRRDASPPSPAFAGHSRFGGRRPVGRERGWG